MSAFVQNIVYTILYIQYLSEVDMEKVLFSLPDEDVKRLRLLIPAKERSRVVAAVLKKELDKREKALYECAKAVEADEALNDEMSDWDITLNDGLGE